MANYNNCFVTEQAVISLKKTSYQNYKIVIVDDCSTDKSVYSLKSKFPGIIVLSTENNGGLCKAFNVGIRKALLNGADYMFMVQNDTKNFSYNYFEEILRLFKRPEKIGIVSSHIYDDEGNLRWDGSFKNKLGISINFGEGYMVKREVFDKVGLFNEKLKVYFEDLDFISRARKFGYKTCITSSVSFIHVGHQTFSKQTFYPNYIRIRNVVLIMRRYSRNKSLKWKIKNLLINLKLHIKKAAYAIKKKNAKELLLLSCALVFGFLAGLIVSWDEKLEK
jgi:hypothetical protein